jgi:hypothetical protein
MRRLLQQNNISFLFCTKHHNTITQKPHQTNNLVYTIVMWRLEDKTRLGSFSFFVEKWVGFMRHQCSMNYVMMVEENNIGFAHQSSIAHKCIQCILIDQKKRITRIFDGKIINGLVTKQCLWYDLRVCNVCGNEVYP